MDFTFTQQEQLSLNSKIVEVVDPIPLFEANSTPLNFDVLLIPYFCTCYVSFNELMSRGINTNMAIF